MANVSFWRLTWAIIPQEEPLMLAETRLPTKVWLEYMELSSNTTDVKE
jgi:hypothetical protein